jgi:hypothetical protein
MGFLELLKLPHVKDVSESDDRALTLLHREILSHKGFLRKLYKTFYRDLMSHVPGHEKKTIV